MNNKKVLFACAAGLGGLLSSLLTNNWVLAGAADATLIGAALLYVQNHYQSLPATHQLSREKLGEEKYALHS